MTYIETVVQSSIGPVLANCLIKGRDWLRIYHNEPLPELKRVAAGRVANFIVGHNLEAKSYIMNGPITNYNKWANLVDAVETVMKDM